MSFCLYIFLIQRMQKCVTSSIGSSASSLYWLFSKICSVSAKWSLINSSIFIPVKRHTEVLKLINSAGRFSAHEFDSILVTQVIRPFYRVKHVPIPIILTHIAQRCTNSSLSRDRMRPSRKNF